MNRRNIPNSPQPVKAAIMCTPKLYREQQHVTTAAVGLALSFHVTVNYAFDWFLAASFTLSPPQQISVEASRRKTGLLAVKMTKRPCPFPETFSSQYKMHIGQQELRNYGVFGNKCRHEIYEKTKTLLFNGAKAVMGKICTGEETCRNLRPKGPAQTPARTQMLLRGQTLIRPDGRLTRVNAAQVAPVAPTGCCVCQKSQVSRTPCSQCDRPVCSSCTRQCSTCSSLCCSFCTIIDYNGRYDEVLCCSCSM